MKSGIDKNVLPSCIVAKYSNNYITKKEPKSDARLSEFDCHDLEGEQKKVY